MQRMRILSPAGAALLAGLVFLGGCAGATDAAPAATPETAAETSAALPPPGTVLLTGDLTRSGEVTGEQLATMPQQTAQVMFRTGKGPEQHTEIGVPLSTLIPPDALATKDGVKNDLLAFAVLAIASDGYAALVAYGEVSPDFGNRGILLAVSEDGAALERPRLVVPGDVKGGRYVTDVVELRVARIG